MRLNISRSIPILLLFFSGLVLVSCSKDKNSDVPVENSFLFETIISGITQVTADVSVSLVQGEPQGLQSFGFAYSDSPNPTLDDNVMEASSGSQSFNVSLDYLEANTSYYIRPFLVDNSGTNYGEEQQFTSLEHLTFNGSVIFNTQQEVDDFGAMGYTKIEGGISAYGQQVNNLRSLSSLLEVGGMHFDQTRCANFEGLDNVRRLGGMTIYRNQQLLNFQGLGKVKNIPYSIHTAENGLESFAGLSSLETIGIQLDFPAGLFVTNEMNLVNFEGLEQLQSIEGIFKVENCFGMENFEGLNSLTTLDRDLLVWGSSARDFSGLESLELIKGRLWVELSLIENFNGLNSLNRIGGLFKVFFNSQLVNFEGFQSLESVLGPTLIDNNDDLISLNGLETWERTPNSLYAVNNDVLVDLCGVLNVVNNNTFPFITNNNAYNPIRQDMENGNCRLEP